MLHKRLSTLTAILASLLALGCAERYHAFGAKTDDQMSILGTPHEKLANALPLHWRLGQVDPRFKISQVDVTTAIGRACRLWETAAGRKLFQEDETNGFPIDLVYDDRQDLVTGEQIAEENLRDQERILKDEKARQRDAVARSDAAKAQFESERSDFQVKAQDFNRRVNDWNASGGAPPDQVSALDAERSDINAEQSSLNQGQVELNSLVREANMEAAAYNRMADEYNKSVQSYNAKFVSKKPRAIGECHTYGDDVERVDVFAFKNLDHLAIVLAHELGHALRLSHVTGDNSIMSAVEEGKHPRFLVLSSEDRNEMRRALAN